MNLNTFNILILIALGLTIFSFFKPGWPILSVAVLLIGVALLTMGK